MRALGNKSADGHSFKADEIISGSFKTIGVVVTQIDLQKHELSATTLDQKQPVVVTINGDSVYIAFHLRSLPRSRKERWPRTSREASFTTRPGKPGAS